MVYCACMNVHNSLMQSLLHALVPLLLCLSANAQEAGYHVGDTIELPTVGNGSADHAAIAVNHFGDTVIVNHTSASFHAKSC